MARGRGPATAAAGAASNTVPTLRRDGSSGQHVGGGGGSGSGGGGGSSGLARKPTFSEFGGSSAHDLSAPQSSRSVGRRDAPAASGGASAAAAASHSPSALSPATVTRRAVRSGGGGAVVSPFDDATRTRSPKFAFSTLPREQRTRPTPDDIVQRALDALHVDPANARKSPAPQPRITTESSDTRSLSPALVRALRSPAASSSGGGAAVTSPAISSARRTPGPVFDSQSMFDSSHVGSIAGATMDDVVTFTDSFMRSGRPLAERLRADETHGDQDGSGKRIVTRETASKPITPQEATEAAQKHVAEFLREICVVNNVDVGAVRRVMAEGRTSGLANASVSRWAKIAEESRESQNIVTEAIEKKTIPAAIKALRRFKAKIESRKQAAAAAEEDEGDVETLDTQTESSLQRMHVNTTNAQRHRQRTFADEAGVVAPPTARSGPK